MKGRVTRIVKAEQKQGKDWSIGWGEEKNSPPALWEDNSVIETKVGKIMRRMVKENLSPCACWQKMLMKENGSYRKLVVWLTGIRRPMI
jgi:hypothetical protein